MSFLSAMKKFDSKNLAAINDDDNIMPADPTESFQANFRYAIQFCWLAFQNKIQPLSYSISQDNLVLHWSHQAHDLYIQPRATGFSTHSNPSAAPTDMDSQVVYTLMSMKQTMDADRLAQDYKDDEKRPGFSNLPPHLRQMILNAMAPSPYKAPAEAPTKFMSSFLAEKTSSKSKLLFQHWLKKENVSFIPSQGFVMALHMGEFLWDAPDCPSNLTIFNCEWVMPSAFNSSKQKELHLKATEGLGLADADIPKAVKQTIWVPKTYFDMLSMTQVSYHVIALIFGETSTSAEGIKSCIRHMINFSMLYESRQLDDPTFMTQVLYDIDSAVQLHLQSCEHFTDREQVNDNILCFDQASSQRYSMTQIHMHHTGFSQTKIFH